MKNIKLNDRVMVNGEEYLVDEIDFEDNIFLRAVSDSDDMLKVTRDAISRNMTVDESTIRKMEGEFGDHIKKCAELSRDLMSELEELEELLDGPVVMGDLYFLLNDHIKTLATPLKTMNSASEVLNYFINGIK